MSRRRRAVTLELDLSAQILAAARNLLRGGFPRQAISAIYYGAFHLVRAALLSDGLKPRSDAVSKHWNLIFVHAGRVGVEHSRLLDLLGADRDGADYRTEEVFSAEDAEGWLEKVERLDLDVRRLLERRPVSPGGGAG